MQTFDAIVVGLGGMGAATLYQLARRGYRALGLEQFPIGHDRGSSHGDTRIIRKAYFEHPDYVPLLDHAYALWKDLEQESEEHLYQRTGLLEAGHPTSPLIQGIKLAARRHNLPLESLEKSERARRFPGFVIDDDMEALFEADAGLLWVEKCVQTFVDSARRHGATVRCTEPVMQWSSDSHGVSVRTTSETFAADRLLLCGGPWAARLLSDLRLPLEVRRKVVLWFESTRKEYEVQCDCPVFAFAVADGFFYGFPCVGFNELKAAEHTGGRNINDPATVDRSLLPDDFPRVQQFLAHYLPGVGTKIRRHSVCLYTMTPDEHFIIDRHPAHSHVAFACGFSGHGFKFAPVIGAALADLVTLGRTNERISFLSATRPRLLHPDG